MPNLTAGPYIHPNLFASFWHMGLHIVVEVALSSSFPFDAYLTNFNFGPYIRHLQLEYKYFCGVV
jgi:hypothetical protein